MAGTTESAKAPAYAAQMALLAILFCVKKLVKAGNEEAKKVAEHFNTLDKVAALLPSIPVGMIATINEIVKEFWGRIPATEFADQHSVFSAEIIAEIKASFPQTESWTTERGWKPLTFLFYSLQQLKDSGIAGQTAALGRISVEQLEECGLVTDGEATEERVAEDLVVAGEAGASREYRLNRFADIATMKLLLNGVEIPPKLKAAYERRSIEEQQARTEKRRSLLLTEDLALSIFLEEPPPVKATIPPYPVAESIAAAGEGSTPAYRQLAEPGYQAPVVTPTIQAKAMSPPAQTPFVRPAGRQGLDSRDFEEIERRNLIQELWHVGVVIALLFLAFFVLDSYYYSGSYLFGHFRAYSDLVLGLAIGLSLGATAVFFYVTSQSLYWRRSNG